jgi:hypothetical protein
LNSDFGSFPGLVLCSPIFFHEVEQCFLLASPWAQGENTDILQCTAHHVAKLGCSVDKVH